VNGESWKAPCSRRRRPDRDEQGFFFRGDKLASSQAPSRPAAARSPHLL